jgi:hypothetical protein
MIRSLTHHRFRLMVGVLGIGALALAGCSSSASLSTAAVSSSSKVTLVVYSAQGYGHAMTTAFQKATGIPVKLDDNSTGPAGSLASSPRRARPEAKSSGSGSSRAAATFSPSRPTARSLRPGGRTPRESPA